MTHLFARVAQHVNHEPLLINPAYKQYVEDVAAALDPTVEHTYNHTLDVAAIYNVRSSSFVEKPFAFANGIAFIPVQGTLLNRFNGAWGFVTGYSHIRSMFDMAVADPDVKAIVFDVNSHGGDAQGCFELSQHIRENKGGKATMSVVDANAYSAGYALASAADKIVVTPSGGAGSIGVVTMHVNYKGALDQAGIEVTYLYAGQHKVDGNPYQPLSDSAKADIQQRIDASYDRFVALVAANRGLEADAVKATQARCFDAQAALDAGLIDAVAAPPDALTAFLSELSGSNPDQEIDQMTTATTQPGAENAISPADLDKAKAEAKTEATNRIRGIMALPEAAERQSLASHLAFNTEMTVEAAQAVLAASAAEKATASAQSPFERAMDALGGSGVGADAPNTGAEAAGGMPQVSDFLKSYAAATGNKKYLPQ